MEKYFDINTNGLNIKCKIYCNNPHDIKSVVVSCHGFAGNKDNNASKKLSKELLDNYSDVAVLTFDWPCHGDDVRKKIVLKDCSNYLNCVLGYIKNNLGVDDIYSQATSFGGYLTLKYISEYGNPFKKVALRCPAVNMYDVLTKVILTGEQVENLDKGRLETCGYDRKFIISPDFVDDLRKNDIKTRDFSDFSSDILIMHGTSDEVIPFELVKQFSENNSIDFVPINGADHRYINPAKLKECLDWIVDFYSETLEQQQCL